MILPVSHHCEESQTGHRHKWCPHKSDDGGCRTRSAGLLVLTTMMMTMLMTVTMLKRLSKMMMKTVRMKMLAWAGGRKFEVNFHVSLVHRIEDLPLRCLTTVNKDQQEERNKHRPRWFGFDLCWDCKCVATVFITLAINKLRWMCDTDRKKALSRMKSSYMSHDQMIKWIQ